MLSKSNRANSADLSIAVPTSDAAPHARDLTTEPTFDVESTGAAPHGADAGQEPGTAAWRELVPGWLSRRPDGSLPLPRALFFYGLALPFCVVSMLVAAHSCFGALGDTAVVNPLTGGAAGFYIFLNYIPGLLFVTQTSQSGLFAQLLDETTVDPRVAKIARKVRKKTWTVGAAFNILSTTFVWSLYAFLSDPSARTVWRTAAVVLFPATWGLLVQYGNELTFQPAMEVALATARWKLRDLHDLAAKTTPANLATDEHHDRLVFLMRSLAEYDLPLVSKIASPGLVSDTLGIASATVVWLYATIVLVNDGQLAFAVAPGICTIWTAHLTCMLPAKGTRLTDICTEVCAKLEQVPLRTTRAVDYERDTGARAALAGATSVGAAEPETTARLGALLAYMAACNGRQGMGFTLNLGGRYLIHTSTLYQVAGAASSLLLLLAPFLFGFAS
jgi:hypothetical protein